MGTYSNNTWIADADGRYSISVYTSTRVSANSSGECGITILTNGVSQSSVYGNIAPAAGYDNGVWAHTIVSLASNTAVSVAVYKQTSTLTTTFTINQRYWFITKLP
jgi:hypothetical protein